MQAMGIHIMNQSEVAVPSDGISWGWGRLPPWLRAFNRFQQADAFQRKFPLLQSSEEGGIFYKERQLRKVDGTTTCGEESKNQTHPDVLDAEGSAGAIQESGNIRNRQQESKEDIEEMSDGRGHLHLRLNYAEELRIKKELERLLKPPQRTVKQDTVELRSSSPLSLMPGPALSQFKQLYSTSRPRSKVTGRLAQPTCQSPSAFDLLQNSMADSIGKEDQKVGGLVKSAVPWPKDVTQELKEEKCLQNGHSSFIHEHFVETDYRVQRPAIASVLGTTKPISIFKRPKPPAKIRSTMSQSSPKPRPSLKPTALQKKETRIQKAAQAPSRKIRKAVDKISSEDSDDSTSSSSSDSKDSNESEKRTRYTSKKKKNISKKMNTLTTPDQENVDVGNLTDSVLLPEQLSKATFVTAVFENHERDGSTQQTAEGVNTTYLIPPVKATARSVDEIIASLRSPQTHTESDMMIKQLMESVLGLNYNITFGKPEEEWNVTHEPEMPQIVVEDQERSPGENLSSQQRSLVDQDVTLTDSKLSVELSFTDKDEEETVQQISISTQENPITPVLEEEITYEEAKQVLRSAAQVTISDIIHVKGDDAVPLTRRETAKTHPPVALLATWKPRTESAAHQTIHHLCTVSPSHVLPSNLQLASRVQHTVNRRGHCTDLGVLPDDSKERMRTLQDGTPTLTLWSQDLRGGVVTLPPHSAESLEEWQRIAEYYVEGPRMELTGEQASLYHKTLKMFWAPAPPKFSAPLSLMQETLFSQYESCLDEQEVTEGLLLMKTDSESSDEENMDSEDLAKLKKNCLSESTNTIAERNIWAVIADHLLKTLVTRVSLCWLQEKERCWRGEEMEEQNPKLLSGIPAQTTLLIDQEKELTSTEVAAVPQLTLNHFKWKKSKMKKGHLDQKKLKMISEELNRPPRTLKRSVSIERMSIGSRPTQHLRSSSLPHQLDFSSFIKTQGGAQKGQDLREWVRGIWNNWFDEVLPPSRASMKDEAQYFDITGPVNQPDPEKKEETPWTAGLDSVPPVFVEDPAASVQDVAIEISYLTNLIEKQERPSSFHYCRRGALHRKLGNLRLALQDLDMVIKQEPQLLDAYWHRHLIFLLQGKTNEALDDLNLIIKYNKTHADAYLSKAEIYKQKKDYTLAIVNYTQALKCQPTNDDIYFRRAQMYEAQDELIIAMDDYAQCFSKNPSRTDALMKHGLYYFENGNWSAAVLDFTAVIKQDFTHVEARTYRGRAYTKLSRYNEAAEEFSAVIHLDPKNWMTFYYRGCLLRKCYPQNALQDFSISVLLFDEFENLNAFLQRGILYTDLGLWSEAAFDFEHVLALDRTVAVAHVNLGLICLLHQGQFSQAVHHFSSAINIDPLCIRAYLCRAQAYRQHKDLRNALKDITRAIHLRPDSQEPYIIRGQYLYEMKKYDLASFCIYHAAEMTQGSSPVQQALVQSFRRQYSNAIEYLVSANKEKPTPALMILLGKIQMKSRKNKDAAKSFRQALEIMGHSDERSSTSDRAEIFYLLGLCYMEQFKFLQALEALTSAVKARSGYCDAYYQRGLCRMHLQQANCVQDFNRALEINPTHFQAYLCRAAFYGFRKRYSKAIMNCNAAIKVQPHSVRVYLYRGALKYYIKAYKLAILDLTKAAELDPCCSLVYYNRGVCYHQMKMYEEALKDYAIVLLLGGWKEADVKVLVNRGLLYLELHDYANALEDFKAVAIKTPGDTKIHEVIGDCHHRLQQYKEAVQAFNQVLQLNQLSPEGYIGRGNAYMEYGHKEGFRYAQMDFVKALHLNPMCIAARICLGYNLQAQGSYQKAWNQFTIALDINPQTMLGFEGRAIVNLQMGDTFAALQDMNAAIKLGVTAQLLTNRGVIHQFMGKLPNAMRDYQSAITANPKYPLAYFNAANMYLHNRQFSQAKDYYSRAMELDPSNESAALNRGITNMLLQDVQGALRDFHMVINLCPVSSAAYFNRASLHNTLQQYEEAESDISQALIIQPGDPVMYKLRADTRGKMGMAKEAIEDYEQAIYLLQQSDKAH
ncbi:PREDICTED: tetratricopeptide repeat protein 6 [Nanorana parkeri]|uniref:tetratricopeptide repeat protein 6 n=1 Tax=Nanorana parkeri TaxID=125878 RepID=UPI000854E29A|nr:PREDICTED: tetratricopeptide repeat protein 6 [Nanorana parkeri]